MTTSSDSRSPALARVFLFGAGVFLLVGGTITALVFLWWGLFASDAVPAPPAPAPVVTPVPIPDPEEIFARRLAEAQTTEELWELGVVLFDWNREADMNRQEVSASELRAWLQEDWEYHGWGDQPGAEALHVLRRLGYR